MLSPMAQEYLDTYQELVNNYKQSILLLQHDEPNWAQLDTLGSEAETYVDRISRLLMERMPTTDIQACRDIVAECAQLHETLYGLMRKRRQHLIHALQQHNKASKAIDAYRPQQTPSAQFQDRHL